MSDHAAGDRGEYDGYNGGGGYGASGDSHRADGRGHNADQYYKYDDMNPHDHNYDHNAPSGYGTAGAGGGDNHNINQKSLLVRSSWIRISSLGRLSVLI